MRSVHFVVACGLAGMSQIAVAQSPDPALTAAIAARQQAVAARDVAGVDRTTASDYLAVNPQGLLNNKAQRLDGLKAPAAPGSTTPIPARSERLQVYGTSAVERSKADGVRQLFVWTKNAQGWQTVAAHIVPDSPFLAAPPANRPKTPEAPKLTVPAGLSADRAAVFAAFKQIQDAFFAGDRATYDKLTAPEHVRLNQGGFLRIGTEGSTIVDGPRTPPKFSDITVQSWDQVSVVRWLETNAAGQQQWLTRVFAKKASGWQQVATASSNAAKAAGTP